MPKYVDGYVVQVPGKRLHAFRRMAAKSAKIWREYGALEFRECVAEDLRVKFGTPFPQQLKLKKARP